MRTSLLFALVIAAVACNPFDPDLPPTPFQCGPGEGPERCPEGYACNANNQCEIAREGPDAGGGIDSGMCGADQAEPNNMQSQPTQTFVADTRDFIEYAGLSICPAMDADYFFINIPTMGLTNLDVTVSPPPGGGTPIVQITNATGTPVANGGSDGMGNIKAAVNNAAQGQYYAVVTMNGMETLSSYSILVDTRRP